jgi:hypothetical protein
MKSVELEKLNNFCIWRFFMFQYEFGINLQNSKKGEGLLQCEGGRGR